MANTKRVHVFAAVFSGIGKAPSDELLAEVREFLEKRGGLEVRECVAHSHVNLDDDTEYCQCDEKQQLVN